MIRINLLGQARPKAKRRAVPLEATLQLILLASSLVVAGAVIFVIWLQTSRDISSEEEKIKQYQAQKAELETLKLQLTAFEAQKEVLLKRRQVIDDLQRQRTGAEELLDRMALSVNRTETLWLTNMARKGSGLTIQGTAGSIRAVANFITEMRRSGYFDKIEIREARQDDHSPTVQIFNFTLTAEVTLPQKPGAGASPPAKAG